jgi:hypothetical protein
MHSCEVKYGEFNGAILVGVQCTVIKSQLSFILLTNLKKLVQKLKVVI